MSIRISKGSPNRSSIKLLINFARGFWRMDSANGFGEMEE
jgi:hypothetical protein